ncbi:type II secretion system protein N [Pseudoalteromonas xiamenensis]|uniref:type II secretion system protein N n=1 Tax=Pseudoalteromonas xiamenensis TaxID=882626 RepID=UPI0027E3F039|nr:type II secretion system protein N [Pseudoalteromonas xiamenensis]WMN58768.1 type II secretion system protein N [Pseudoalteromonas xiamenensis]
MKNTLTLTLIFLVSFVLFVFWQLPATIAIQLSAPLLPPTIQFGQLSGSVWEGHVTEIRVQQMTLKNVYWDITPAALFTGRLQLNVKVGNARDKDEISGHGDIALNVFNQHVTLDDAVLRFSVEQAMGHVTLPLPVEAKGRVLLNVSHFSMGTPYCEALVGDIRTPNIDVKGLNNWFSIGELEGGLDCKSGNIAITVSPDNKLGLQADALLSQNLQFNVNGKIKPDASLPKEVHDAVKFLGRADSDGYYPIKL